MNKRVYNNGYIPKIEYWLSVSKEAIKEGNVIKSEYALQKAEYFMGKHQSVYGNTIAGVDFTETLKLLATL